MYLRMVSIVGKRMKQVTIGSGFLIGCENGTSIWSTQSVQQSETNTNKSHFWHTFENHSVGSYLLMSVQMICHPYQKLGVLTFVLKKCSETCSGQRSNKHENDDYWSLLELRHTKHTQCGEVLYGQESWIDPKFIVIKSKTLVRKVLPRIAYAWCALTRVNSSIRRFRVYFSSGRYSKITPFRSGLIES